MNTGACLDLESSRSLGMSLLASGLVCLFNCPAEGSPWHLSKKARACGFMVTTQTEGRNSCRGDCKRGYSGNLGFSGFFVFHFFFLTSQDAGSWSPPGDFAQDDWGMEMSKGQFLPSGRRGLERREGDRKEAEDGLCQGTLALKEEEGKDSFQGGSASLHIQRAFLPKTSRNF